MFRELVSSANPDLIVMGAGSEALGEDEITIHKFVKKGSDVFVTIYDKMDNFRAIGRFQMEIVNGKLVY